MGGWGLWMEVGDGVNQRKRSAGRRMVGCEFWRWVDDRDQAVGGEASSGRKGERCVLLRKGVGRGS